MKLEEFERKAFKVGVIAGLSYVIYKIWEIVWIRRIIQFSFLIWLFVWGFRFLNDYDNYKKNPNTKESKEFHDLYIQTEQKSDDQIEFEKIYKQVGENKK